MDGEKLARYKKYLKNKKVEKMVAEELINLQLASKYKGFQYLKDVLVLSLQDNKFSMQPMNKFFDYISYKYDIKEFSVQRQMRYTCTLKGNFKVPEDIYNYVWERLQMKVIQLEDEKDD